MPLIHWGVYGRNGFEGVQAFCQGAIKAGGIPTARSVSDYTPGQSERFDAVAVFGLQWKGRDVLQDYTALGVPVFVIDYGYLKRTNHAHDWRTGHWQVSLGGLNRVPTWACDSSRFDALGIEIAEQGGDPMGYPLLCVQTPGDASHGLDEKGLEQWAEKQARKWPGLMIRPHPLQEHLSYGLPICPARTLEQALKSAMLVVTGNSNSGHDALLAGVPALATMPGAAWASLSGPQLPALKTRTEYFRRAAWGQWTWAEFRTGQMHDCLIRSALCWS